MPRLLLAAALCLPTVAFAAGSSDSTPPATTKTTTECTGTQVYDEKTESCVDAKDSRLDDDTLYQGARELAYAGRYDDAIGVLSAMGDQDSDGVLTYLGFAHRARGDMAKGMAFYARALAQNPDNLLARSYMGQAHVIAGHVDLARLQLDEIRTRGGMGGWPEVSLRMAIETGRTATY
ncbi:tetratricopeptide repeat protein [Oceaniglobus trochenteri]|uniref:tetratricopeptide repeat protein n=1 Tax=Oceaniglobus trochenteri TaxID=2763260 RepID=UPI001CFF73B6|nr:hypothetical protein [Oceaniglobus trochenteri]